MVSTSFSAISSFDIQKPHPVPSSFNTKDNSNQDSSLSPKTRKYKHVEIRKHFATGKDCGKGRAGIRLC